MTVSPVGFIGLGNMGRPLATNIRSAGFEVLAYDKAGTEERLPDGCEVSPSIAALGMAADPVVLSLPGPQAVAEVTKELAERGRGAGATRLVIDTSTIGIAAAITAHSTLAAEGIEYLDSPVSGGVAGALKRTLVIMFSGSDRACSHAEPILNAMSANVFRVGSAPGSGQAVKLANNFLSATALSATSEAVAFVESFGVDARVAIDVINHGTGRNTASEDKFPNQVFTQLYQAGFTNTLMNKDLRLYSEAAAERALPGFVRAAICDAWNRFATETPQADITRIYPFVRDAL